jgi:hypothetical protein
MLFGDARITPPDLAEGFVSGVVREMSRDGEQPPYSGVSRTNWTRAVLGVLKELGNGKGFSGCYPWLVDFIWWDRNSEHMALAAESELSPAANEIADDFQKLTVLKCPLKLFVFRGDAEKTKSMAEQYLKSRSQHVKDEEYLLVGFTDLRPRCFFFTVPNDGNLQERVQFSEPLSFTY